MKVKKPEESVQIHCCRPASGGHHVHLIIEGDRKPSAPFFDKSSFKSYLDFLLLNKNFPEKFRDQTLFLLEEVNLPDDIEYEMAPTVDAWNAFYCFCSGLPHYILKGGVFCFLHCDFVRATNHPQEDGYYPLDKTLRRYFRNK